MHDILGICNVRLRRFQSWQRERDTEGCLGSLPTVKNPKRGSKCNYCPRYFPLVKKLTITSTIAAAGTCMRLCYMIPQGSSG